MAAVRIDSVSGNGGNLRIDAEVVQTSSSGFITRSWGSPNQTVFKTVMMQ